MALGENEFDTPGLDGIRELTLPHNVTLMKLPPFSDFSAFILKSNASNNGNSYSNTLT